MSALEQVSKLETLLARIHSRAAEPRTVAAPAPTFAAPMPAPEPFVARAPSITPSSSPRPPRVASILPEPPPRVASIPPEAILAGQVQTTPPPSMGSEPPPTQAEMDDLDVDGDMDVEVSSETVEIDIDDPMLTDEGFPRESGSLPVAAQARAPIEESLEEHIEDLVESIPPAEPPANEVLEPAPSSSPRPIESYETAPRHTPPPESGKQVAIGSVRPEPRMSSTPPPSEGHTLMGGWREPGMPLPRGEARPGVRVPPPPPPPPPPAELISRPRPPPPPAAIPSSATPSIAAKPLTSEPTFPSFAAFAEVGVIESPASSFAPITFGDLLDASLSL